jgi:hypothetical protein
VTKSCIFRHTKLLIGETYVSGRQSSDHGHSDVSCRTFQQVVAVPGARVRSDSIHLLKAAIHFNLFRDVCICVKRSLLKVDHS